METQEIKYIDSDNEVYYILNNSKCINMSYNESFRDNMLNHPELLKEVYTNE